MGAARKYAVIDPVNGKLDRRIFSEQAVYDDEMEKIFGRAWLMIGHESLVPEPDDFFHTYMGEDPVLVTRAKDGQIRAFLNSCRHRGMKVCRADEGNTEAFTCSYHAWTYASDGRLIGVPHYKEAYFEELDRAQWGLVPVAQLDAYPSPYFLTDRTGMVSLADVEAGTATRPEGVTLFCSVGLAGTEIAVAASLFAGVT